MEYQVVKASLGGLGVRRRERVREHERGCKNMREGVRTRERVREHERGCENMREGVRTRERV